MSAQVAQAARAVPKLRFSFHRDTFRLAVLLCGDSTVSFIDDGKKCLLSCLYFTSKDVLVAPLQNQVSYLAVSFVSAFQQGVQTESNLEGQNDKNSFIFN